MPLGIKKWLWYWKKKLVTCDKLTKLKLTREHTYGQFKIFKNGHSSFKQDWKKVFSKWDFF
ncbi:MAG: hypothetical protein AVO38_10715 [delta proteobacterium ML8_D]|nr:MAG: hypothetical protein AVO38_10715 [delta proteobacterium ML8_D]